MKTFFVEESFSKEVAKSAMILYLIRNVEDQFVGKCLGGRDYGNHE